MQILKKVLYIIIILSITVGLNSIPWIPSTLINILLQLSIMLLFIWAIYLAYQIVIKIYEKRKNKEILMTITSSILLSLLIGFFFVIHIASSIFPSSFIEEYHFQNETFYLYDIGFIDPLIEVTKKHSYLPIQSESLATVHDNLASLSERNGTVFLDSGEIYKEIYDLRKVQ